MFALLLRPYELSLQTPLPLLSVQKTFKRFIVWSMPTALTRVAVRLRDSLDEFIERMEDGEAGRRDKYGRKTQLWHDHEYQRKQRVRRHRSKKEDSERLKRIKNDSELDATMHGAINNFEDPEGGSRGGPPGEGGIPYANHQTGGSEHGTTALREDHGGRETEMFTQEGTHSSITSRGGSRVYPSSRGEREHRDSREGGDTPRGGIRRGSRQCLHSNHSNHDDNLEVAHQSKKPKALPQSEFALEGEFIDPPPTTVDQEVREKRVRFAGLEKNGSRQPRVEKSISEEPELDRKHHNKHPSRELQTVAPAHPMKPEPYLEATGSVHSSEARLQNVAHALVNGSQPLFKDGRREVQPSAAGMSQPPLEVERHQQNISPMPSMGSMTDRANKLSAKKAEANAKRAKCNAAGTETEIEPSKLVEPQGMNDTTIPLMTDDSISVGEKKLSPVLKLRGGGQEERSYTHDDEPYECKLEDEDEYNDHEDFDDEYTGEEVETQVLHSVPYVFERDRRTYGGISTEKFSTNASPLERERPSSRQDKKTQDPNANAQFMGNLSPPRNGFGPSPLKGKDWKRSEHPGEARPESFKPRPQPSRWGGGLFAHEQKLGRFGVESHIGGLSNIHAFGNATPNTRPKPTNHSQQRWGAQCPPKTWHGSKYIPIYLSSSEESVTCESEEEEEEEEEEVQRPARGHAERRKAKKEPPASDFCAGGRGPKNGQKAGKSSTGRKRPKRDVSPPDYAGAAFPPPNHYATLGLEPNASMQEIKLAAKKKRIEKHPDKLKIGKSQEECAKIDHEAAQVGMAADVLTKPTEKSEYDEEIRKWKRRYGFWPNEV
ncbi:MAG: hypothetical protein Q9167_005521 [Letrouitia subvulpina]